MYQCITKFGFCFWPPPKLPKFAKFQQNFIKNLNPGVYTFKSTYLAQCMGSFCYFKAKSICRRKAEFFTWLRVKDLLNISAIYGMP